MRRIVNKYGPEGITRQCAPQARLNPVIHPNSWPRDSRRATEWRWRSEPDRLVARLHAASTLSLNCIRLARPPGGPHEPLLDHADESETRARDSPCLGPIG